MKLLAYIKMYPEGFIQTIIHRSETTPSDRNRENHLTFAEAIEEGYWEVVEDMINSLEYRKPLDGVIACLVSNSGLDFDTCVDIYELWNYGEDL